MAKNKKGRGIKSLEMRIFPYALILPNLLIFVLFIAIPAVMGIYYSMTDFKGIGTPNFIGIANYVKMAKDSRFWASFWRTWKFSLITLPLVVSIPLLLAMLMTMPIRMKGIFRAIFYWPSMISYIVVGLSFKFIFGETTGVINYMISLLGIPKIEWLTNANMALGVLILATVWSRTGFFMVNYIAGLQSIPDSYYEASLVDGASKTAQFFYITLPLLKPTMFLVMVLGFLDLFKSYGLVISMTNGGPASATKFVVQFVYEKAFQNLNMGYASALSMLMLLVMAVVTVIQFTISRGGQIND